MSTAQPVQGQLIVNAPPDVLVSSPDTTELVKSYTADILPMASYTITTPEQYVQGNIDWQKAKLFSARIDELFENPVKLAHQAHKSLTTLRATLKAPADQIAAHVGAELMRYKAEQDRLDRIRAAEEAKRLEAIRQQQIREAEAAAEAERQRLAAERAAALEAVPEWERDEEFEKSLPQPEAVVVAPPPPPVEMVRIPSSVPTVAGGPKTVNTPWSCAIDDPVAVLKWVLEKPEERISLAIDWRMPFFNSKAREHEDRLGQVIPGTRGFRGETLKRS